MLTIPIDGALERRLREAAARLGKSAEECVLASVRAWVADCEEAAGRAARLGGEGVVRPPEGYWD